MCGVAAFALHFVRITLTAMWGILEKNQWENSADSLAQVVIMEVEKSRKGLEYIVEAKPTGFERVWKAKRNQG